MSDQNHDDLAGEARAKMREEVARLTAAERKVYAELINEAEPPPAPDYSSMNDAEFRKVLSGIK